MKKIAIVNNKGGVGKTTTTFNLAWYFANRGFKVLALDTDPQLNLTWNLTEEDISNYNNIGDYLLNRASEFNPIKVNEYLHLLTCGNTAEDDMHNLKSSSNLYYKLLDEFLDMLDYDIVIIDTAPSFSAYTVSAVYCSDVYITMSAGINELRGLETIMTFTKNLGKDIKGIILTRIEKTAITTAVEDELKTNYKEYLLETKISKNVALAESILEQKSIFDYAQLGDEILRKEELK